MKGDLRPHRSRIAFSAWSSYLRGKHLCGGRKLGKPELMADISISGLLQGDFRTCYHCCRRPYVRKKTYLWKRHLLDLISLNSPKHLDLLFDEQAESLREEAPFDQ